VQEAHWRQPSGFRSSHYYPRGSSTITHVACYVPAFPIACPGRKARNNLRDSGARILLFGVVVWPAIMEEDNAIHIGMRNVWGGEQSFGLLPADRRYHTYVIGKTGSGKRTLLRNLILQDIAAGHGVGLIDPHGDLAFDLLDHIPRRRTGNVVYLDPGDTAYPIGLNLLHHVLPEQRHLAASGIVSAFKGIWSDSWGPRTEYILTAAVAALLDADGTTLLGVQRMFTDPGYLRWVVKQVKDPIVRQFWTDEFSEWEPRFMREAIAPIQNKVGRLLMSSPIRNIVGQVRSKIDAGFMMNKQRILIANLAKGRIGAETANLIGALLVTEFQLAAMARADMPEDERQDFHLYIDEFHNFSTDAFATVLSEARKYRLCLTLSHQYVSQLTDDTRNAVFGNVGNLISFRVGESDAKILEREIGGGYSARHFGELPNFHVCVKLLRDGEPGQPFNGRTVPPDSKRYGRRETIIRHSREKYATRSGVIEDKIKRWMGEGV
jgi:hypothetical protein